MDSKRRKLEELERFRRAVPYTSQTALSKILEEVERAGVPELYHRRDVYDARELTVDRDTPYGPMVREAHVVATKGAPLTFRFVNLWAFMWVAYGRGGSFRELIRARHGANPSSRDKPWRLILYTDEVVPGLQLVARDNRKFHAIYGSILEYGPLTLSNELSWCSIATKESVTVSAIAGGISQIMKVILRDLFLSPTDPGRAGILVGNPEVDGDSIRIFLTMGPFVMDGSAFMQIWQQKGESGMRPCMNCPNLFAEKTGLHNEDTGEDLLTVSLVSDSTLVKATDASVWNSADKLAEAHARGDHKDVLLQRAQVSGLRHEPHGLVMDVQLRAIVKPIESYTHDPQHTLWVGGVWQTLVYLLFETMWIGGCKGIYDALRTFLAGFHWPKNSGWDASLCEVGV